MNEETNPRKLTTLLSKIVDSLEKKDVNKCFRQLPVPNSQWAENYIKVIPNIIDFTILQVKRLNGMRGSDEFVVLVIRMWNLFVMYSSCMKIQ